MWRGGRHPQLLALIGELAAQGGAIGPDPRNRVRHRFDQTACRRARHGDRPFPRLHRETPQMWMPGEIFDGVEVAEGDVSGIEIKIRRGATISGVVVIENNFDPAVAAMLQTLSLYAFDTKGTGAPSFSRGKISSDGSILFSGLAPGKVQINVAGFPAPPKGLTLVRTEVDGVDQREGIELTAGAQIKIGRAHV